MKKLLLSSIIILFLSSCASDSDPIAPSNTEKSLVKVIQMNYYQGSLEERIVFIYENNKPKIDSFYNADRDLTGYSKWSYNSNNLLSSIKGHLPNGTVNYESSLIYDNDNRIIQEDTNEDNGTYISVIKFTHNNDNTISSVTTAGNFNSSKTFHINNDGLVYKETNADNTITVSEVVYNGNNPVSKIAYNNTLTYTYDEVNMPKGIFLTLYKNLFGENKANPVLWGNNLDDYVGSSADKFLIKEESNSYMNENKYTFDTDGYPIRKETYYNNELGSELEYIYQ